MKVSVIVRSYNGKHKILNLLNSLSRQTFQNFDIIIVIDGSTDGTEEFLAKNNCGLSVKVYSQENKGRAAVRNRGASLAEGDLLIFFDDDMRPEADCIEQHIKHQIQFPNSLMSGAQIDDIKLAATPFQKYKCYLSNKWVEKLLNKVNEPLLLSEMHLTAANFSISKSLFQKLGGFDERLKDNEDLDLAVRAHYNGNCIFYKHAAFAWHDDLHSCKTFIKRQIEYLIFHDYVRKFKKDIYSGIPQFSQERYKNSFLTNFFYSLWEPNWWVTAVDKSVFVLLPRKMQFKLYNWIVYAQIHKHRKSAL